MVHFLAAHPGILECAIRAEGDLDTSQKVEVYNGLHYKLKDHHLLSQTLRLGTSHVGAVLLKDLVYLVVHFSQSAETEEFESKIGKSVHFVDV